MHPRSRFGICSALLAVLLTRAATAWRRTGTDHTETSIYSRMPPVYHYEDKLQCLHEEPTNVYCISRTLVKPDSSSENWNIIEKNSAEDTDFQRYVLDRGFCVKNCETLVNSLTQEQQNQYDHEPVSVDTPHTYDSSYIPGMDRYRHIDQDRYSFRN